MSQPTVIVFALYPGLTQLGFTGPHEVFANLPDVRLVTASAAGGDLPTDGGLTFAGLERLSEVRHCDVLCVPGGLGLNAALTDDAYVTEVRRLGRMARYVTSVCTGSLILGAAGFLEGRRAACHWAWRDLLETFGAIPDPARVVRDGDIFTAAGVTAGVDFALVLAAELAGEPTARAIQLMLEYAPEPPFDAGRPDTAPAALIERVKMMQAQRRPERLANMAGLKPE